jgi:sarcosine oxidase subunit beta
MDARADFVLVGAGVYGAYLAWKLAARGASVVVLERATVASGASGGFGKRGVRANGRDARELPLARRANEIWPTLGSDLGADTGYVRTGQLDLFEEEKTRAAAEARVVAQTAHGIDTRLWSAGELREREPAFSPRLLGAVYCADDGVADHTSTTHALVHRARALGATVWEQADAVDLELEAGRAAAVRTRDGRRVAVGRRVVFLTNAGLGELLRVVAGATVPFFDVWPQALVTEPVDAVPLRHLIAHMERRLVMKALPGGEVMITGGWLGRPNPETGVGEALPEYVDRNLAEAVAVVPALAGVRLRATVADRAESVGPELVPIIDFVPGVDNAMFAGGWTGHGWAIAPAVCEYMTDWVLGGERPALLAPFALSARGPRA